MDYTLNMIENQVEFYNAEGNLFFTQPTDPATGVAWKSVAAMKQWAEARITEREAKDAALAEEIAALEATRLAELAEMEAAAAESLAAAIAISEATDQEA